MQFGLFLAAHWTQNSEEMGEDCISFGRMGGELCDICGWSYHEIRRGSHIV